MIQALQHGLDKHLIYTAAVPGVEGRVLGYGERGYGGFFRLLSYSLKKKKI